MPNYGAFVTVYRVQPKGHSNIVTGGAFCRARESGSNLVQANKKRQKLLEKILSSDDSVVVKALQNAQASGRSSPFISTTFDEKGAIAHLNALRALGIEVELLTIQGPRSGGIDFEAIFKALGGRTKANRAKDADLQEFGIPDLFIPATETSRSGFRIIDRQ